AAKLMMETLFSYQKQDKFLLHAFVIMPDHLHLLIAPQGTISLEKAMQFIKGVSLSNMEKSPKWRASGNVVLPTSESRMKLNFGHGASTLRTILCEPDW